MVINMFRDAAGFYSSMTYKMFRGIQWKQNTLMTAFLYPGIVFAILFAINLVLWVEGDTVKYCEIY